MYAYTCIKDYQKQREHLLSQSRVYGINVNQYSLATKNLQYVWYEITVCKINVFIYERLITFYRRFGLKYIKLPVCRKQHLLFQTYVSYLISWCVLILIRYDTILFAYLAWDKKCPLSDIADNISTQVIDLSICSCRKTGKKQMFNPVPLRFPLPSWIWTSV